MLVLYYYQGEVGESLDTPNAFQVKLIHNHTVLSLLLMTNINIVIYSFVIRLLSMEM